jgi:endonuclease YncB( thermonuclease family)
MLPLILAAGVALACASPHVHDGDTLTCAGRQVRLWGMDAPELDGSPRCRQVSTWACDAFAMRWGLPARDRLIEMTRGAVRCQVVDVDRYGRTVGLCEAGGVDLGRQLVAEGLARDYTRYSRGRYLGEEARARRSRQGMWTPTRR